MKLREEKKTTSASDSCGNSGLSCAFLEAVGKYSCLHDYAEVFKVSIVFDFLLRDYRLKKNRLGEAEYFQNVWHV